MNKLLEIIPPDAVSADFIDASHGEGIMKGRIHVKTVPYCIAVIPVVGRYEVVTPDASVSIESGEALLTTANLPLKFIHYGDPKRKFMMMMKWVHFHFSIFGAIDFTSMLDMPLKLDVSRAVKFGELIDELLSLQESEPAIAGLARRSELGFRLLSLVCSVSKPKADALGFLESSQRLKPVLGHMKRNLHLKTAVSKLAKLANLSPSRFHSVFREITGSGPMEHQKKLRLNAAFRLVMMTDDKLKSVAEKTGFCNEFHLSRDFKANYGKSPREYRRKELINLV
ncbi:MAG: AraC family transcriptional regulator [Victivallales bacterium]|jgi:AraC-like DNA-binding protein